MRTLFKVAALLLIASSAICVSYSVPSKSCPSDSTGETSCGDNEEFRYEGDEEQSCSYFGADKYRRASGCAIPEIAENCKLTCFICCYDAGISSKSPSCTFAGSLFAPPDTPSFRHPPFTKEALTKELPGKGLDPVYGVLKELAGTWVNYGTDGVTNFGLHTTSMPSPGTNPTTIPGKFHFLCENYVEELTFTPLEASARNRGTLTVYIYFNSYFYSPLFWIRWNISLHVQCTITIFSPMMFLLAGANEQFIGAIKYEQVINNEKGKGIHDEVGMYLWLKDMYNHPATEQSIKTDLAKPEIYPGFGINDTFVPSHSIARSGTIPHGSTIQLFGNDYPKKEGKPVWPVGPETWKMTDDDNHLTITRSMGGRQDPNINLDEEAPWWVNDPTLPIRDATGNQAYTQRILAHPLYPYSARPDLRLRDTIKDQNITEYTYIELNSVINDGQGPQGGVLNTPLIQRSTPINKVTVRLWLEKVYVDDGRGGGKFIDQLQYEQVMFFVFQFGTDGKMTKWPHIQVNTLRRKEDVLKTQSPEI